MSAKFFASFILGAAAGFAAAKYMNMTDEEKAKLKGKLKEKASNFKEGAEEAASKAKEYIAKAEGAVNDFFKKKPAT